MFYFKKFSIQQDQCAMKVCTDSCLFGAWATEWLQKQSFQQQTILDIGTGTGLLALMLAQKTNACIEAVEIDAAAARQAAQNIAGSSWATRIHVHHLAVQDLHAGKKFDFVISNPPFYQNDLVSPGKEKNMAKHHISLSLDGLFMIAGNQLSKDGALAILLPFRRRDYAVKSAAEQGLFPAKETLVKQTATHSYFRSMMIFMPKVTNRELDEISIKGINGGYTDEFIALLKDYYLYL